MIMSRRSTVRENLRSAGRRSKWALGRFIWRQGRRLTMARAAAIRYLRLVGWRRECGPRASAWAPVRRKKNEGAIIPVVLCVWRRPHLLQRSLDALTAQTHAAVRVCIWNNSTSLRSEVENIVTVATDVDVEVLHSIRNIGGFGRFYFARHLATKHDRVVFIDDDQVPGPLFLSSLVSESRPGTAVGTWGHRFRVIPP